MLPPTSYHATFNIPVFILSLTRSFMIRNSHPPFQCQLSLCVFNPIHSSLPLELKLLVLYHYIIHFSIVNTSSFTIQSSIFLDWSLIFSGLYLNMTHSESPFYII